MRGNIRKRGATYQIRVDLGRDPITGKRKEKSESGFTSKKEAEKALAILIASIEKGEYFEADKMTLKDYLDYWLETYAKVNVAPSTYIRYNHFRNTIIKHLGNVGMDKLKPAHIQKFYTKLISEGKQSNSTILKTHRMLHLALKHAVGWQMINNNPTDAVTPPRAEKYDMSVWDVDTAKRFLIDIKDETIYIPVLIALYTGMRQGEVCGLKWDCIDLSSGIVSVKYTLQRINSKLQLKEPKTKKSIRTISLPGNLIKELKEYRKKQLELKLRLGDVYEDNNFVCSWDNGAPMEPHYVGNAFAKLVKKLKYSRIRFHDLRHTHATMLLQQGVNPKIVSERLGHSTISLTLDTYSHVLPNMQKQAAEKLDELFAK